jgi:hypothetical protein
MLLAKSFMKLSDLDHVVWEHENAARQELHETERLDPVVRERENADRHHRYGEENNEIRRGAITDTHMSTEDFIDHIRKDKNGESFSLADKNVNNSMALFYANVSFHKFGQHLKFRDPPPTLDQVAEQVIPGLNDALLSSKDVKEIELDFDRHHSYYSPQWSDPPQLCYSGGPLCESLDTQTVHYHGSYHVSTETHSPASLHQGATCSKRCMVRSAAAERTIHS